MTFLETKEAIFLKIFCTFFLNRTNQYLKNPITTVEKNQLSQTTSIMTLRRDTVHHHHLKSRSILRHKESSSKFKWTFLDFPVADYQHRWPIWSLTSLSTQICTYTHSDFDSHIAWSEFLVMVIF